MQLTDGFAVRWTVAANRITFTLDLANATGYVALGISPSGSMKGADMWVFQRGDNGQWSTSDMHAVGFQRPLMDAQQDIRLESSASEGGTSTLVFSRPLVTCDAEEDLPIRPGVPNMVVWAFGSSPRLTYHGSNRGAVSALLAPLPLCDAAAANMSTNCSLFPPGPAPAALVPQPGSSFMNVTFTEQEVPTRETTYMCRYLRLPADRKYHITSYEGIYSPMLHHMVLFRCPPDGALVNATPAQLAGEPFDCTDEGPPCMEYMAVWAPGLGAVDLPPQAGLPFGKGEDVYFVLNAHYNNPEGTPGFLDSSGFLLQYTSQLRPHDLGILTLGQTNLVLPPGRQQFSAPPNRCPAACTSRFPHPVNVFTTFLHMHQAGSRMAVQHVRQGRELQPLAGIRGFDFDFNYPQASVPSTRVIQPGDDVVTTCTYNTVGRTNTTRLGLGSRDEMCFAYVGVWPRLTNNISSCMALKGDPRSGVSLALCGQESRLNSADWSDPRQTLQRALLEGWLVEVPPGNLTFAPYQDAQCPTTAPKQAAAGVQLAGGQQPAVQAAGFASQAA